MGKEIKGAKTPTPPFIWVDPYEVISSDVMIPIELLEALGLLSEVDRE